MSGTRQKVSTMEQRLKWLRRHKTLWEKMPLVALPHGTYRLFLKKAHHVFLAREMQHAGLFAKTTYPLDIPVHKYVRILRGLR